VACEDSAGPRIQQKVRCFASCVVELENFDSGLREERVRGAARGFRLLAESRRREQPNEKEEDEMPSVFSIG